MRNHRSILGTLFIVWGIIQAATGLWAASTGVVETTTAFWFSLVLVSVVYIGVGVQLRRDMQLRLAAGILSALALISFPIGTPLGIYGLWVVIRAPGWESRRPPGEHAEAHGQ